MFIYLITTDLAAAEQDAAELGWMRIALERWVSPDRNDIRMIRSTRQFVKIPSGSWFLPARDLRDKVGGEPYAFKRIVESGDATWIENPLLGEEGTIDLVESIKPPPPPLEAFTGDTGVEAPSPLHNLENIRDKARAAAQRKAVSQT